MIFLIRAALRWVTYLYLGGLLLLLAALHWYGERNWLLSLLLFAPAAAFLLPMGALIPLGLLFGLWRLLLAQVLCAAALLFVFQPYGWHVPSPQPASLTLATYNIGEGDHGEIARFLAECHPDVVLLEDASGSGPEFVRLNPAWHLAAQGQFVCLSKLPVLSSRLPHVPGWNGQPVAARFEIQLHGQKVALYSVHLPTPREHLQRFLSRDPLLGLQGYRSFVADRNRLGDELATLLVAEKEPMIAAGDFNTPDHGYVYHRFTPFLTDAFRMAGRGWGFTFPADATSRWAHGPWLRIDYVWAGHGWTPLSCEVSSGQLSQHHGVVARLKFER